MRKRVRQTLTLVVCFSLILLTATLSAQVNLYTSIDTTRGFIGDVFHYQLEVDHPEGYRVHFPDSLQSLGDFIVRDIAHESNRKRSAITYALAVYDTGSHVIPPLQVVVNPADNAGDSLHFQSGRIPINILSLVPPDSKELKDLKPLMSIPKRLPWLLALGALAAVVLGVVVWRKKRTKREPQPAVTPEERRRTAHEVALSRLEHIRGADYPGRGEWKQHFSEISETIRQYFEDRYFVPALEMTTTEVMRALPVQRLPADISRKIAQLLERSDLVKFAKYFPTREEARDTLDDAFEIVERTRLATTAVAEVPDNEQPMEEVTDDYKHLSA